MDGPSGILNVDLPLFGILVELRRGPVPGCLAHTLIKPGHDDNMKRFGQHAALNTVNGDGDEILFHKSCGALDSPKERVAPPHPVECTRDGDGFGGVGDRMTVLGLWNCACGRYFVIIHP